MSARWSIATFQQQQRKMSLYEFKLHMELCGYETYGRKVLRFYKDMKRKYQNNIYEFPNSENRELMEQKKRLAKIIVKIEQKMQLPYYDVLSFDDEELQAMANFGETITFAKPNTASRVMSVLSNDILKKRDEEYL